MTYKECKYTCKHCHVEVVSPTDTRAILGREHAKSCPRSKPKGKKR